MQSEDYDEEYISFPLAVTLQQRLYLQVSVDTPDTRLGIVADTCYATPINSISKKIKYDIIVDRSVLIIAVAHIANLTIDRGTIWYVRIPKVH